jgi:hypothetical protein
VTSQEITEEFTAIPVNVLTQTHELVEASSDQCNKVGVLVTASRFIDQINGVTVDPPSLTATVDKNRNEYLEVTIRASDDGETSTLMEDTLVDPMQDIISVYVNYLEVVVEESPDPDNTWTYDFGSGFTSYNKFGYDSAGQKTIYVKDSYGCQRILTVTVEELPIYVPSAVDEFFYISKGMSLRYVDRLGDGESFDNCTNYKTDENTFDCEVPYKEDLFEHTQKVKRCGPIETQFKSNYLTHSAQLWRKDRSGDVLHQTLTINEVQTNMEIQDVRDCYITHDELYTYLYFLDGKIPLMYKVGAMMTITTVASLQRQILGFEYLEEQSAYGIKVSTISGDSVSGQIIYVYNRQDYNVYEFDIDAINLPSDSEFYVKLRAERGADIKNYQTADFYVENSFEQTVDIDYFNDVNTDIYYQSGIKNRLCIGIDTIVPVLDIQLETISTDSRNYLRESFNREKRKFKFEPLTLGIVEKLIIALAHERLIIDGTSYACESVEMIIPEDYTNLYVIEATCFKSMQNVKFVAGAGFEFDWSSGGVTFDNSITFDRTAT